MILAILQGRLSSRRLPGKVLKPILGKPMILRQLERLQRCQRLDGLVVATSVEESDTAIAETCANHAVPCVRGPLDDVLGRFVLAIEQFQPTHVVRLTADCPLADWKIIDQLITRHLETGADYTSNALQRTYPKGLDCEIVRADVLLKAHAQTKDAFDREHVTPFIYKAGSGFQIAHLTQEPNLSFLRWTVDLPEDFAFVSAVYEDLYPDKPDFTTQDILSLMTAREDLRFTNATGLDQDELTAARRYWSNQG